MEKQVNKIDDIKRKFGPTLLALKNKTTIYILTFIIILFGVFSYNQMPRETFPEIVIPYIIVQTVYPGNSPVDIENLITRPIEKELKGMDGVKKLSSASYQDVSMIVVEFETTVAVKQALQDTKDNVDKAKSELPSDLPDDPAITDVDFAEFPILNVNLSGDFSMKDLKKYAELLKDEFEGLTEISEANIRGVDEREIQININPYKLEANGLSYDDVAFAVRLENVTIGGGEFTANNIRRVVRTEADFTTTKQIEDIIIKMNNDKAVYMRDIADVVDGYKEKSTISRLNNSPVVTLAISKKAGGNILDATEKIYQIIDEQKANGYIPQNLIIITTDDSSQFVRDQISNLENSIILGIILVVFVLFLFLGFRNALFSGLAIPMSMFLSFVILDQSGVTLNTMVLFSLVLALGMLVDNAIVVVENVYRLYGSGYSLLEATKSGVSEIAFPIITSTLTTLAAFFPLLMWEGVVGQFMGILPKTLIIVLSSSLFVALVLNPPFIASFMKIDDIKKYLNKKRILITAAIITVVAIPCYFVGFIAFANILMTIVLLMVLNLIALRPLARWFQTKFLVALENAYENRLRKAITGWSPIVYFLGTIVLLIFSLIFYSARQPSVVFFPDSDPRTVFVTAELPLGTSIDKTDEVSRKVEAIVESFLLPYKDVVKSVTTTVGNGKGGFFEAETSPNKTLTTISFVDFKDRGGAETSEIMKELTDTLHGFVGAKIFVQKPDEGPPVGAPVNIEISGDDFDELLKISDDFLAIIENDNIQGIDELKLDINIHQPEMKVIVDRDQVRRFKLSTQSVAMAIRNSLYGYDIGDFKDGEEEYDIFLRLDEQYRNDVSTLMNQKINHEGTLVPISSVASFEFSTTFDKVSRIDHKRVVTISSNIVEGYNANEINKRIEQVLMDYDMPKGYKYDFTGEQQQQDESSEFLIFALFICLALITIILVTQFNSFIRPMIIIMTVVFSTIGVFLGLSIFKMEFVIIMTGIGIISLAGIVVNNGIVLIDYIDLLRRRKREELGLSEKAFLTKEQEIECLVTAGKTRLRPVLLTAITTVLGLLPLAIGFNFDFFSLYTTFDPNYSIGGENVSFWGPMSWTVIFGLTFATVLTLIIAPVMYMMTIRISYVLKKVLGKLPEDTLRNK